MVQRKVPNKVGIKPNPIKDNNQIVNQKPYSFSSQNHEIKNNNKGVADLKKKMMKKKSGKINFTRHLSQPGKPPPLVHPTPKNQQQKLQQQSTCTPNYMKSTSSSVARKEQSQVSSRNLQTYPNSNKSKLGSANSVNKPTRSMARNSSLKLVRTTLTKTPSFKPVRSSAKKSVRATCSSTLKEAKFPSYLELSPGGTESDGTSVFKVCPYTYCSLNGHHHPPLPPLKCFLSARRRTFKTQRNFKLGCLSPRRANPHALILNENAPTQKLSAPEVAPLTKEDDREFFIEIYSKAKEEMADPIGPNIKVVDEYNTTDSTNDVGRQYSNTEDTVEQKTEGISAENNMSGFCPAENMNEEIYMPPMVQEEEAFESFTTNNELEIEDSEASDMDWDVEKCYAYSDGETNSITNGSEPITLVDNSVVSEEHTEKSSIPELLSDDTLEESLDKESIISVTYYGYDDSQSDCSHTEFDIVECVDASEDTSNNTLDATFMLDGEITEKAEDEHGSCLTGSEIMDNQADVMEDEISVSPEEWINIQDDDEESSDENIVVKIEATETKADCCEQGNENGHDTDSDKELVLGADHKGRTNEDHTSNQAEEVTENTLGVEAAEACGENVNQIKDAPGFKEKKTNAKYDSGEELSERYTNLRGIGRRNDVKEAEESREFNPRTPNFLPLEPDPEAEKVDLKHQMMDDRKNAEDWMLDFALRRAVDKLAPARKRKVALLVEAFETVLPTSKWEPHLRRSAAGFPHPRPVQACR